MGSVSSKAAKAATGASQRQYPTRIPKTGNQTTAPASASLKTSGPKVHSEGQANTFKDEAISLDGRDPDFARSLRSIGPVQPAPTYSPSSRIQRSPDQHAPSPSSSLDHTGSIPSPSQNIGHIFPDPAKNPAIMILTARERLATEAEAEFARAGKGREGRRFLDVMTIRQILMLRDENAVEAAEIEKRLGLKPGIVARLGAKGIVGDTSMSG